MTAQRALRVAVVGGGWAGMAAAVEAAGRGADVTVFEASRVLGGRARCLEVQRSDGQMLALDNGQHILIGAYSQTLALMQRVGVNPEDLLMGLPLALPYPDGLGLQTPSWAARWPAPLNAVAAIATARGWRWRERLALIGASLGWQRAGFVCDPALTVGALCRALPARVMDELIEPLCVSALNLPSESASAQVFLRVMRDALFGPGHGPWAASSLLLPRDDLGALLPEAAARWLAQLSGGRARVRLSHRVRSLEHHPSGWQLAGDGWSEAFDRVVWATAAPVAAQAVAQAAPSVRLGLGPAAADAMAAWSQVADGLAFTAITTVYAWAPRARLAAPMLALRALPDPRSAPAQFVFDRGQMRPDDPALQGVLAFVISASEGEREVLQQRVLQQAADQLGLSGLQALQTVVEKRATFACTPGLHRPGAVIAPGLWAAGDHVDGPYPATLESAVRSGLAAGQAAAMPG